MNESNDATGWIEEVLQKLAQTRPVFQFEVDFRKAFAQAIHDSMNSFLRLSYKPLSGERMTDLWLHPVPRIAINLRYKTRDLEEEVEGKRYNLAFQRAQDQGRYDYLSDIEHLESVVSYEPVVIGFAILLTNDWLYWEEPTRPHTIDREYRIHEGRTVAGELAWTADASDGSKINRNEPIRLRGKYAVRWRDYSTVGKSRSNHFRYLMIPVTRSGLG